MLTIDWHFTGYLWFVQIGASGNAVYLKKQEPDGQSSILFNFSKVERGEKEPLLLQYGGQYSS